MELLLNPSPFRPQHGQGAPSSWLTRHAGLIPGASHHGHGHVEALDVACGGGRHVRWLAAQGCRVTALDRDALAVAPLRDLAEVAVLVCDIEAQPWPLAGRTFDVVVVTNYLWRPLLPTLVASVAPGGVLFCETFASGNASVGRPARPEFLLQPGELLDVVRPALKVVAFEDGYLDNPPRFVQRVVAVHLDMGALSAGPARHPLAQVDSGTS